jgi:uncharacterized protein YneF (UPF0154 family)
MAWYTIAALIVVIPIILFPVAFIWFVNIGGIYTAIKQMRAKRIAQERDTKETVRIKQPQL